MKYSRQTVRYSGSTGTKDGVRQLRFSVDEPNQKVTVAAVIRTHSSRDETGFPARKRRESAVTKLRYDLDAGVLAVHLGRYS
jgi:hypothetical protein